MEQLKYEVKEIKDEVLKVQTRNEEQMKEMRKDIKD